MPNFKERLVKHIEKVIEYQDLIYQYSPELDDSEIIQESFRIMEAPQNEDELIFSESYLSMLINTAMVASKVAYNETKVVPIKDNKFIKALIEEVKLINAEERAYNYTPYEGLSIDEAVKLTYDAATFPGYEDEEIIEYICRSLRIGRFDDLSKRVLASQLADIQFNINLRPLANNLSDHMKRVVELSKKFESYSESQEIKNDSYDEGFSY